MALITRPATRAQLVAELRNQANDAPGATLLIRGEPLKWVIAVEWFTEKAHLSLPLASTRRPGEARMFSTLDAAWSAAYQILADAGMHADRPIRVWGTEPRIRPGYQQV